jgi:UDP-N-acetylglucosamine--N-acetylmuramyl-(pentapeptide) pyrophosphoryl-undecaprenol N-acetylglucosamine transferase
MIEQQDLTVQSLVDTLNGLERPKLLEMACNARNAAIIDADVRVATAIKSLAK